MNWKNKLMKEFKTIFKERSGCHDIWHLIRTANLCKNIGKKEKADLDILWAAALLHDVSSKSYTSHVKDSMDIAQKILKKINFPKKKIPKVLHCIETHEDYHWTKRKRKLSREAKILQDADRLDAVGAIGIDRCFTFCGSHKIPLFVPGQKIKKCFDHTKLSSSGIIHFYEKLLKLQKGMNTRTGKSVVKERHQYMENFVKRFLNEWKGKI